MIRAVEKAALEIAAERFPIGARVRFQPAKGQPYAVDTEVASAPWRLGGRIVVRVAGQRGGVCTSHLTPV